MRSADCSCVIEIVDGLPDLTIRPVAASLPVAARTDPSRDIGLVYGTVLRPHDQVDGDRTAYPALQKLWES
jgi:hypothetical protein